MSQDHGATLQGLAGDCGTLQSGFNFGTDINYGTVINSIIIPDNNQEPFTAPVSGLLPSTTYHYQAFAGTIVGGDKTFTTPADAPVPTVTTLDATNVY